MSGDEEWVREKWNRFGQLCKTPFRKKDAANESSETLVASNTTTNSNGSDEKNLQLDAYAKGYQDGRKAGLANYQESTTASKISSRSSNHPASPDGSTEIGLPTHRQIEHRAMRAGWNKAWEAFKRDGWTKGCAHCSARQRHENALSRRRGTTVGNESLGASMPPSSNQDAPLRRRGATMGSEPLIVPYINPNAWQRPTWRPWSPPPSIAATAGSSR